MKTLINLQILTLTILAAPLLAQQPWTSEPGPGAVSEHVMIRDQANDRFVLFGGMRGTALSNQTWVYQPVIASWQQIYPAGIAPSARREASACYDAANNRMIVFGGTSASGYADDAFALDLTPGAESWSLLAAGSATRPAKRTIAQMVMDSSSGRAILYGGYASPSMLNDVWELSLTPGSETWSQIATTGYPGGNSIADAAVFDPIGRQMLVYRSYINKLYALKLDGTNAWSNLTGAGMPQGQRRYPAAAYDSLRHQFILHGGLAASTTLAEVHAYDIVAGTWTQRDSEPVAEGRFWHTAAYDEQRDCMAVVGGRNFARVINPTMGVMHGKPQTPVILTPADGEVLTSNTVELQWAPAMGLGNGAYVVEIFRVEEGQLVSLFEIGVAGEVFHFQPLVMAPGVTQETYAWRVMAYNQYGSSQFSATSIFVHQIEAATPENGTDNDGSINGDIGVIIVDNEIPVSGGNDDTINDEVIVDEGSIDDSTVDAGDINDNIVGEGKKDDGEASEARAGTSRQNSARAGKVSLKEGESRHSASAETIVHVNEKENQQAAGCAGSTGGGLATMILALMGAALILRRKVAAR